MDVSYQVLHVNAAKRNTERTLVLESQFCVVLVNFETFIRIKMRIYYCAYTAVCLVMDVSF
jgi:hypothetical protein